MYEKYTYRKKKTVWTDADSAVRNIKKGKRILIGSGCAEPHHLVEALVRNAQCFRDNEVVHILTVGIAPYADPRYARNFRHNAFFIGHNIRESVLQGHSDYMPVFLSEIPSLFKTRQMPLHAVLIQVSPPDGRGFVSLGVSVDILPAAIAGADIVVAQVNRNMPETCGEARIPPGCIDFFVEADEPLIEFPQGDPDEISMKIGKHLSRYIRDGDTLQLGIGAIPNAVLLHLNDKHDLGIHSEMVSDGIIELYRNGNITNKRKCLNKGKTVISFVLGTKKIFELIDKNRNFQFFPTEYTNDPFVISRNPNVVSINSAIQIDLTGQVCSDSIGARFYSGFGGQVDFVRGAKRSEGGRSFIALPSTAKNGSISRIVTSLSAGAGVVTTRADVHYVATEYGVAYLHGKNIRERGLALVQIAHPQFRDELLAYLKEKHYVYIDQRTIKDDDSLIKDNIPHSVTFKGKTVYFRPLRPFDEKAIQDFFYSHRPETIYQRYLTNVEALPHEEAQTRVSVDYNKDMAIAGFDDWRPYAQMVCLGRYIRDGKDQAEVGLVVKENYQGIGIGKFMCGHLIESAKLHGITRLFACVAHSNAPMLAIFKRFGFSVKESRQIQGYYLSLDIQQSAPSPSLAASGQ
ncbi:MAG: GNAT family N-acetyltransferase [Candidatus Omnitrophica bacterium]|nr:GNAT family N-acetyltransferase [Candidatus Omnitrophota bacterium]